MGTDIQAQKNPDTEYVRAVKRMSAYIFDRFFMALAQHEFIFNLTPTARKQKKELKILHDFTDAVVVTRKEQLEAKPNATIIANDNDDVEKPKLTFLDLLLSSSLDGRPLTNAEIREQVDTFMFEGHDTTTSAISFAIYHLSQNQVVQEKAYQEVAIILSGESQVTHANLQDMKYLEMVIKETLRVHPSVPLIGRILSEDTELGGVMVPKGIDIGVQIFAIHRNPEVFPEPERFIPERFTENFELRKNPYEYIPFSAGPRNCIGESSPAHLWPHSVLVPLSRFRSKIRHVRNEGHAVQTPDELQNSTRRAGQGDRHQNGLGPATGRRCFCQIGNESLKNFKIFNKNKNLGAVFFLQNGGTGLVPLQRFVEQIGVILGPSHAQLLIVRQLIGESFQPSTKLGKLLLVDGKNSTRTLKQRTAAQVSQSHLVADQVGPTLQKLLH
jgi:Cytochrome P450